MGIRFACPNGHPLHVKAELAGKRGICPECQVRFVIPQPAGQARPAQQPQATAQAAAATTPAAQPVASTPAAATASTAAPTPPPSAPMDSAPSAPAESPVASRSEAAPTSTPATPPAEQPMWYVRPASGGQFGPADDALVHQWAGEGRLAADSYVWRTGWPDWRLASELPEHFPQLAGRTTPTAAMPSTNDYNNASASGGTSSPEAADVSLATARYRRRKMRSKRSQQLAAAVLILLTIILAVVLVWVLVSTSSEPDTEEAGGPPTTQMPVVTPDSNDPDAGEADTEDGAMDEPAAMNADQL